MSMPRPADKDSIKLALENNPCPICRYRFPQCTGHGGGGGGGGGGGSSSNETAPNEHTLTKKQPPMTSEPIVAADNTAAKPTIKTIKNGHSYPTPKPGVKKLTAEEMLKLLSLDVNRAGDIILHGNTGLSKEQDATLQSLFHAIQASFNQYVNILKKQNASTEGFSATLKDNTLTIKTPHDVYRGALMRYLIDNTALPNEMVTMIQNAFDKLDRLTPKPMSTRPW